MDYWPPSFASSLTYNLPRGDTWGRFPCSRPGTDKVDTATRIKCAISSNRKALKHHIDCVTRWRDPNFRSKRYAPTCCPAPFSTPLGASVAERLARSPPTKANQGSIPGRVTEFSHVGIVPDDAVSRRVFSGISRFPRLFILAAYSMFTSITLIGSQDLAVKSRQTSSSTPLLRARQDDIGGGGGNYTTGNVRNVSYELNGAGANQSGTVHEPPLVERRSSSSIPADRVWYFFFLRYVHLPGTIHTRENPGVTRPGIEPGSPRLNFTMLYALKLASFLHWQLHRCEGTPSLTELRVIGAHNCEVFLYWRRVAQGRSHYSPYFRRLPRSSGRETSCTAALARRRQASRPTELGNGGEDRKACGRRRGGKGERKTLGPARCPDLTTWLPRSLPSTAAPVPPPPPRAASSPVLQPRRLEDWPCSLRTVALQTTA
ncbi:hypothetical protein PR048_033273 [Dryococelus australis]|uniref:Uncharacterized protein n=1 Tax=Dryococelus australis TaxID=614101 RepID=A0ABQ9G2Y4_9NEOP|nr:hypothetical protein PR048_033273 [Dryococelus australis]